MTFKVDGIEDPYPQYGDKELWKQCDICKQEMFKTFRCRAAYHNDTEDYWDFHEHHLWECVKVLVARVEALEGVSL